MLPAVDPCAGLTFWRMDPFWAVKKLWRWPRALLPANARVLHTIMTFPFPSNSNLDSHIWINKNSYNCNYVVVCIIGTVSIDQILEGNNGSLSGIKHMPHMRDFMVRSPFGY